MTEEDRRVEEGLRASVGRTLRLMRAFYALPEEDQRSLVLHAISMGGGEPGGFTCPRCGRTSAHPRDQAEGYCGACHDWTVREERSDRLVEQPQSDRETGPAWGGGAG